MESLGVSSESSKHKKNVFEEGVDAACGVEDFSEPEMNDKKEAEGLDLVAAQARQGGSDKFDSVLRSYCCLD